jgi:C1A family cysteine protease
VGKLVTLSSQQVFDCASPPVKSTYIKAFEWVKKNGGIASAETYKYVGRVQACKRGAKNAAVILGYRADIHTERDLMRAVNRQPVAVTMMLHGPSFSAYRGGIFTGPCGDDAHAMLVVGYGATADGRGYWIVKNSYGVNWGDHGYLFVQRGPDNGGGLCGVATWGAYPA